MSITSQEIMEMINGAITTFGTIAYERDARDVMDVTKIANVLNAMPVLHAIEVMEQVAQSKHGESLVYRLLVEMQSVDEDRWDEIMENNTLWLLM